VSFFPDRGNPQNINQTVSNYLNDGIGSWNSELRTNPTSFDFDVLRRVVDNDSSASIQVRLFSSACGIYTACSGTTGDNGTATISIDMTDYNGEPDYRKRLTLPHELGHAFAQFEDHDVGFNCASVMGDGCGAITLPQAHDNGDLHDVFNQGTQKVERVFIQEFNWEPAGFHHRLFWDPPFVGDLDQQHGESHFVILRSQSVYSGFADWSGSSRNSHEQDGTGWLFGSPQLGPSEVGPWFGVHSCFRIRPATLAFGSTRVERLGKQTSAMCIVRSPPSNPNVVSRTNKGNNAAQQEGIFVTVRNENSSSAAITTSRSVHQAAGRSVSHPKRRCFRDSRLSAGSRHST
jgi:hypothetical protein